jgi:selenium metabolism protein YedF
MNHSLTPTNPHGSFDDHIIVIKSDKMGMGDDDLGALLIKGFINSIGGVTPLPTKIILYNSGAKLVATDSPVLGALRDLEAKGCEILVCGTCADFFQIKEQIAVGSISNMPTILESMTAATKIVAP